LAHLSATDRKTLAYNAFLSMRRYGLVGEDARLTAVGEHLCAIEDDVERADAFARHILLHLNGMRLLLAVRDLREAGTKVTLEALPWALEPRGVHCSRGSKHASIMRAWLAQAQIFDHRWNIDWARVHAVVGAGEREMTALESLPSTRQRERNAFLRALARAAITSRGPFDANTLINEAAAADPSLSFPDKTRKQDLLHPLVNAGLITIVRSTARNTEISPTPLLTAEVLDPLLKQVARGLGAELLAFRRKPVSELLAKLRDGSTHERGLSLEALAILILDHAGFDYRGTRVRRVDTGGAEIDALFESRGPLFFRWSVQAKATTSVTNHDVARELGMLGVTGAHGIILLTTGAFTGPARALAERHMTRTTNLVYLIDGEDLGRISRDISTVREIFERERDRAASLMKSDATE
jgi:hypothetical protein